MVGLHDQAAGGHVLVLQSLRHGPHLPHRHGGLPEQRHPVIDRPLAEYVAEDGEQLGGVALPIGQGPEAHVLGQLRHPDHRGDPGPELLLGGAEDEPAVGALERLERHDRRMGRVHGARRRIARVEVPDARIGEHRDGGVVQRHVAVEPDPVPTRGVQAGDQRQRRDVAGGPVDDREAGLRRRAAGLTGDVHPSGQRLQHVVVAGLGPSRAGHAVAAQRAAHDPRVEVAQIRVGDADLRRYVAPQVGEDRVAGPHQALEDSPAGRVLEIEGDRLLAAVEGLEEQRVGVLGVRRHVAADVPARVRILDLDDLRAEIGEVLRAERTGAVLLDRDDPDTLEGQRHGVGLLRRKRWDG